MKTLLNRFKGFINDKRVEKKEKALAEKRAALASAYSYAVPMATVATLTAVALSGNFSFI